MSQRPQLGTYTGTAYRKHIIAKLEKDEAINAAPTSRHDKMMAEARKRVLSRLKALEVTNKKVKKIAKTDINIVLERYKHNAMEESYTNVYGKKAEMFGTP